MDSWHLRCNININDFMRRNNVLWIWFSMFFISYAYLQVTQRCPEGTLIPLCEWVCLQFWPKTPSAVQSLHHTGRFKLKFMVQQRQWRHQHIDSNYAADCFRYMKEYTITIRDYCSIISFDEKHKVKIGEPEYPVAAAERGWRVPVREDEYMTVGDHDFTKFSLIPSVIFRIINIPRQKKLLNLGLQVWSIMILFILIFTSYMYMYYTTYN